MSKATLQCCLSTAWGGLEMVVFETAVKMRNNGFAVTTVCPPGSPLQNKLVEAGLSTIGVQRKHKYFAPSVIRVIRKALKTGNYSTVLVQQTNDLWQVVPALIGMKQIRLVCVSHSFLGISKKDFLHSILYGRCDRVVALNENHRRNLIQRLPVKEEAVEVVVNTVDPDRFHPSKRSQTFRDEFLKTSNELLIGVVSRLDPGKGVMEAVRVAKLLKDWKLQFQMVFIGKETIGEEGFKERMEDEIRRLNLRDCVHFAGHRGDVENVIASLDILLMPSPAETFGRVLIEAMASGVPIVASSGGGVSSIIRHHVDGILAKPLDIDEMAEGIRFFFDNPDKRKKIADNGIAAAHDIYDYRKVDRKLYDILGMP